MRLLKPKKPYAAFPAIKDRCNHFLSSKKRKVDAGKMRPMPFDGSTFATVVLVEHFGGNRLIDDLSWLSIAAS